MTALYIFICAIALLITSYFLSYSADVSEMPGLFTWPGVEGYARRICAALGMIQCNAPYVQYSPWPSLFQNAVFDLTKKLQQVENGGDIGNTARKPLFGCLMCQGKLRADAASSWDGLREASEGGAHSVHLDGKSREDWLIETQLLLNRQPACQSSWGDLYAMGTCWWGRSIVFLQVYTQPEGSPAGVKTSF